MNNFDSTFDYIARVLQKTARKAYEGYVISRLWHKINDPTVKLVPQQYVNRASNLYALTDVYFPQFKIHIEVNEPAHYKNNASIQKDRKRKAQIEKNTGHRVLEIDCRKKIELINGDIDRIVNFILEQKRELILKNQFIPWDEKENTGLFWRRKNTLDVDNDISLSTIEEICKVFNINPSKIKRGFQRTGGAILPANSDILVWWPAEKTRNGWTNCEKFDFSEIEEKNSDREKSLEHYKEYINLNQRRIVFFKHKDILGIDKYKFVGIYVLNESKSRRRKSLYWKRKSKKMQINPFLIL